MMSGHFSLSGRRGDRVRRQFGAQVIGESEADDAPGGDIDDRGDYVE